MLFYSGDDFFTIRYSKPIALVELNWHGIISSDQLRYSLNDILGILKENEVRLILLDAKKLNPYRAEDQAWLKNYYFPKLNETQLVKLAHVTEPDLFTQAVIGNLMQYVNHNKGMKFSLESFYEREEALEWLLVNEKFLKETKAL